MTEIWSSPVWPRFDHDPRQTEPLLARAERAIGELTGLAEGLAPPDRSDLALRRIVQEALASFGIEGVRLPEAEIEASVVASLRHRRVATPARRSDAIAALMEDAMAGQGALTAERLFDWHRLLFHGMEIEDLGRWRRFDIEIVRSAVAGAGADNVLFRAPPPERVATEMARLLDWLSTEESLPVPVRAAIAHLWFETIHPFSDGNGRIGRALVDFIFARSTPLPFPLSRQIERDKAGYYQALQDGRRAGSSHVDATGFVTWFLQTLERGAGEARSEALFLVRRNRYLGRHDAALGPRGRKVLEALFAQGPERVAEGLSARSYARIARVSGATATRDLTALARAGALRKSAAGGRSTRYEIVI
ncbi:Fic family protein [Marinovum sp.]|uniref:Fic family protein n=1 Tax=Marinovum sp. TaxID=2024839 RepID=UPI002B27A45C|nr:Fic family protein [Marinovum sp.]